jgi:maltose-binding protein MalE
MSPMIEKGLEAITARTNLATGLSHTNDMNAAKEMFVKLHEAGEILLANEVEAWATSNGWQPNDAAELGALAEQIGMGKKPGIQDGPWWNDQIIEHFQSDLDKSS